MKFDFTTKDTKVTKNKGEIECHHGGTKVTKDSE